MRRLAIRTLLLALPLLLLVAAYVISDPFRVLWRYDRLVSAHRVQLNRSFVATETLLGRQPRGGVDSYILGNSRSLAFLCDDWKRHLPAEAQPYHFDASAESLFGVLGKLRLLARHDLPIRHALLVVDAALLEKVDNGVGPLFVQHPEVSGESRLDFQLVFARAFVSRLFFVAYADHRLTGAFRPYMASMLEERDITWREAGNDLLLTSAERELAQGEDRFYERRARLFARPSRRVVPRAVVGPAQQGMLAEAATILAKSGASWQVVVSPLYDQIPLHPDDLAALRRHFGAERVHDFSGINELTSEPRNFYETSHYRPHVAREIMTRIYGAGR